ncbi:MAG: hypothetical protein ACI9UT_002274 [Flavobacteriales bacterium]|jgi:hypothetical protein
MFFMLVLASLWSRRIMAILTHTSIGIIMLVRIRHRRIVVWPTVT